MNNIDYLGTSYGQQVDVLEGGKVGTLKDPSDFDKNHNMMVTRLDKRTSKVLWGVPDTQWSVPTRSSPGRATGEPETGSWVPKAWWVKGNPSGLIPQKVTAPHLLKYFNLPMIDSCQNTLCTAACCTWGCAAADCCLFKGKITSSTQATSQCSKYQFRLYLYLKWQT